MIDECPEDPGYGHDYLFCCSRTADDDEGVIIEHFVCADCDDDFED